jgi:hypothetical protein
MAPPTIGDFHTNPGNVESMMLCSKRNLGIACLFE